MCLCFVAFLAGCGSEAERERRAPAGSTPRWVEHEDARWGYRVRHPEQWHRATTPVAPRLTEPREILSLATFPPRHRPTDCEAFGGAARSDLGVQDVFVTVQERGHDPHGAWNDFPARPSRFGPVDPEPGEHACGDPPGTTIHWRNFSDAGRRFHTLVAIGPQAGADARDDVWRILDSLRLDPDHRPDWPASE